MDSKSFELIVYLKKQAIEKTKGANAKHTLLWQAAEKIIELDKEVSDLFDEVTELKMCQF